MPRLLMRGAFIRFVDLRFDEKSKTVYARLNLTAAFSEPVREAMEWGPVPSEIASAKLDGEFTATRLTLTPNGRELKQHEVELDAKEIRDFCLFRVQGDDGESTSTELRFQIVTADPNAAAKLAEYLRVIGKGEAQLRVNYEAQSELEMEAEEDQERLISPEQAADTAEESDDDTGAPLAPAAVMGGTHQRGRKKDRATPIN